MCSCWPPWCTRCLPSNLVSLGRVADWVARRGRGARRRWRRFTPEAAAPRCGLPADTIRSTWRRLIASYAQGGWCTPHRHLHPDSIGTLASWLVDVHQCPVPATWTHQAARCLPKAPAFAQQHHGQARHRPGRATRPPPSPASAAAPEVFGELPITCLAEEIETPGPGQVRALITVRDQPGAVQHRTAPRLAQALDIAGLHGQHGHLPERNHTPCRCHPARPARLHEDLHYDIAFPQLSWRNHARYSAPGVAAAKASPKSGRRLLRAGRHRAVAKAANRMPNLLDDQQFADDAQRLCSADAAAHRSKPAACAGRSACWTRRCAAARTATGSAREPEGLNLQGDGRQRQRRHRPGRTAAPHSRNAAHPERQGGAAPPSSCWLDLERARAADLARRQHPSWSSSAGATCAATTAGCTTCRRWPKVRCRCTGAGSTLTTPRAYGRAG